MLEKFLDSPLIYLGIALAAIFALSGLYKLLKPRERTSQMMAVKCPACGWSGNVGRYNMKCSKCGSTKLRKN